MKRLFVMILLMTLLAGSACAELEAHPFLDTAFSMLEEDNLFIERYNELTGSNVEARFELGMPYMFGGHHPDDIFAKYPDYNKRKCYETTHFYREGKLYIYGFDCSGFTKWIYTENGYKEHPSLSDMVSHYGDYKKHYVYTSNTHVYNPMPAWDVIHEDLQPGDLFVIHHGARHILMFIGTLRDYGFTGEENPELKEYLDYPLVIHCGPSPVYGARFEKFIAENADYSKCLTTNGGVQVSILGVPLENAPYHEHVQIDDFDYFLLGDEQQIMTVYPTADAQSYCWWRVLDSDKKK